MVQLPVVFGAVQIGFCLVESSNVPQLLPLLLPLESLAVQLYVIGSPSGS
ncbi:hypothetical protein [Sulfurihydrogenibium sp.]|nr:hypothetical protein [Sulfurihydrogenibium sp.]